MCGSAGTRSCSMFVQQRRGQPVAPHVCSLEVLLPAACSEDASPNSSSVNTTANDTGVGADDRTNESCANCTSSVADPDPEGGGTAIWWPILVAVLLCILMCAVAALVRRHDRREANTGVQHIVFEPMRTEPSNIDINNSTGDWDVVDVQLFAAANTLRGAEDDHDTVAGVVPGCGGGTPAASSTIPPEPAGGPDAQVRHGEADYLKAVRGESDGSAGYASVAEATHIDPAYAELGEPLVRDVRLRAVPCVLLKFVCIVLAMMGFVFLEPVAFVVFRLLRWLHR